MRHVLYLASPALFFTAVNDVDAKVPPTSGEAACVVGSVNYERRAQFGPESIELTEQAAQNLRLLAIAMRSSSTPIYILSGDGLQRDPTLSMRRSAAVKELLVSEGIAEDRLLVDEFATTELFADGLRILSDIRRGCSTQ